MADRAKMTAPAVLARKGGPKLVMITAYDHPSALIASEAGIDIILVGDSLANVVHGYDETLLVDLDIMVQHTAAVSRAEPKCLVVGDLPWMSYHISVEETVRNAGRLVRDGGAEAVKLEGGRKRLPDDPRHPRRRDPCHGAHRAHPAVGPRHGRFQGPGQGGRAGQRTDRRRQGPGRRRRSSPWSSRACPMCSPP